MPRPTRKAAADVNYSEQPAKRAKTTAAATKMGSGASTVTKANPAAAKASTSKKAVMERGDSAADLCSFKGASFTHTLFPIVFVAVCVVCLRHCNSVRFIAALHRAHTHTHTHTNAHTQTHARNLFPPSGCFLFHLSNPPIRTSRVTFATVALGLGRALNFFSSRPFQHPS